MARKLASIQVIHTVEPIEGADFIEIVRCLGWRCVAKKGEFKRLDRCVYFEIDSLLPPDNPAFAFMKDRNFRVKTIKLRGQISQGLALPLTILPEWARDKETGFDVSDILGIIKYEPPEMSGGNGKSAGNFPGYIPKTDETRIQSCEGVVEELKDELFYRTVKIDGTSSTFGILDGEISVCSRTRSIKDEDDDNVYWRMARKYNIIEILKSVGDIAIQGEIAGYWHSNKKSPIQKNRLGLSDSELFIFDVYDIKDGRYYGFEELSHFCVSNGLPMVHVEDVGFKMVYDLDELLLLARGKYPNGHHREGLVFRTMEEKYCKALKGRASFKVINNDFLLKVKE